MVCKHQDFLSLAKDVLAKQDSEIEIRTAANRAYYSVHHLALAVREKYCLPPAVNQTGGSHQKLYNALIECSPGHHADFLKIRQIGYMAIGTLKPYRVRADYHLGQPFSKNDADTVVAKAEELDERLRELL